MCFPLCRLHRPFVSFPQCDCYLEINFYWFKYYEIAYWVGKQGLSEITGHWQCYVKHFDTHEACGSRHFCPRKGDGSRKWMFCSTCTQALTGTDNLLLYCYNPVTLTDNVITANATEWCWVALSARVSCSLFLRYRSVSNIGISLLVTKYSFTSTLGCCVDLPRKILVLIITTLEKRRRGWYWKWNSVWQQR